MGIHSIEISFYDQVNVIERHILKNKKTDYFEILYCNYHLNLKFTDLKHNDDR